MKAKRPPKPTQFQSRILAMIAHSPLTKTYSADHKTIWALQDGREISEVCATALVRNGWVKPQRDGLGLHEDSQTYTALKP
jgi:L-alanine-DL-glutamate epimerase-like enolase superfamily enzyme